MGVVSGAVHSFKFHQNQLSSFGDVGSKYAPSHCLGRWLTQQLQPYQAVFYQQNYLIFTTSKHVIIPVRNIFAHFTCRRHKIMKCSYTTAVQHDGATGKALD